MWASAASRRACAATTSGAGTGPFRSSTTPFELAPDTPVDFQGSEVDFLAGYKGIPVARRTASQACRLRHRPAVRRLGGAGPQPVRAGPGSIGRRVTGPDMTGGRSRPCDAGRCRRAPRPSPVTTWKLEEGRETAPGPFQLCRLRADQSCRWKVRTPLGWVSEAGSTSISPSTPLYLPDPPVMATAYGAGSPRTISAWPVICPPGNA